MFVTQVPVVSCLMTVLELTGTPEARGTVHTYASSFLLPIMFRLPRFPDQ